MHFAAGATGRNLPCGSVNGVALPCAALLLLVAAGTVQQFLVMTFALDFFSQTAVIWQQMILQLPFQLLLNFLAAIILLRVTVWLQRTFMPRKDLPGLRKLDKRYES